MHAAKTFDVIVIGVGAMGASACWQLAQRGLRVLGLDRYSIPNAYGSSHGQSRALRLAYFEHPDYVPLLKRALELWAELGSASGEQLLILSGGLYIGKPDSMLVGQSLAAAQQHSLAHELLDERQLRQRWPQFGFFEGTAALYEPVAGICRVEPTITAMAGLARAAGAQLLEHQHVLSWQAADSGVRVVTADQIYEAQRLIICPGAYANNIVQTSAVDITPTRQVVAWFEPRRPALATTDRMPVWALELPDARFYYGFAALPDSPGLKLGSHRLGTGADPAALDRSADSSELDDLAYFAHEWLPDDAGELATSSVCLYENSPDGHFIIDWHPDCAVKPLQERRVLLACGGSGHSFKFAPVIGEILAEMAATGTTQHNIGFLSLSRFG